MKLSILLNGQKGPMAVLCKQYVRTGSHSLKGVRPEDLGSPGLETWQDCTKPLPDYQVCAGEGVGLFWQLPKAALPWWVEVTCGQIRLRFEQA